MSEYQILHTSKNVRIQAGNNVRLHQGRIIHDNQSWNSRKSACFQAFCGYEAESREIADSLYYDTLRNRL